MTMTNAPMSTTCDAPHPTDPHRLCNYDGPHDGADHADGLGSWPAAEETGGDVRTRHLIVTLPASTGEEADSAAELIDDELTDGFTVHGTATHALGETVLAGGLPGVRARRGAKNRDGIDVWMDRYISADEARQLAGALLTLAHDIDRK